MNAFLRYRSFENWGLILLYCFVLLWSFIGAFDRFTWFLEVLPALVGLPLLVITSRSFTFSRVTYWVLLFHAVILMIGGHYTYANVPYCDFLDFLVGSSRNNFDKIGHFFQGFTPALLSSQLLFAFAGVHKKRWLSFLSITISMAISAWYELFEWGVAVLTGTQADAFLGTQGYVWDTQSDMLFASIGALVCIGFIFATGLHSLPKKR